MKASQFTDHEQRITRLEVTIENINQNLVEIKDAIKQMDVKFENKIDALSQEMHQGFKDVNTRIDNVHNRIWSNFLWMLLFYTAGLVSVFGVMAKGFHWLST